MFMTVSVSSCASYEEGASCLFCDRDCNWNRGNAMCTFYLAHGSLIFSVISLFPIGTAPMHKTLREVISPKNVTIGESSPHLLIELVCILEVLALRDRAERLDDL